MPAPVFDEAARSALGEAIAGIERASSAEVVIALRRSSGRYLAANVVVGVAVAFVASAYMLYAEHAFSYLAVLCDPFLLGLAAGVLVEWIPIAKRAFTRARWRERAVAEAARVAFFDRGVANTRGRTGVLVYLSWLERDAVLLADGGVRHALGESELAAAEGAVRAALPFGGKAVAAALAPLGRALARRLPRLDDDRNELADALDLEPRPAVEPAADAQLGERR